MTNLHDPILTHDELAAYHEHGYVRLGKVAPDDEINALCQRIDDIMLGKIRYDKMLMQLCPSAGKPELSTQTKVFKGSTLKYRKVQDLEQDPLFLPYIQHPLFRDITRKIIGDEVSAFRTMFFNKPAGQGVPINWHQDGAGGWKLSIPPKVTIYAPDEKRLYLEMEMGEVVLLHNWTLHRSEVNTTNRPRRAFSVCYVDAATYRATTRQRFPKIFPEYVPVADE